VGYDGIVSGSSTIGIDRDPLRLAMAKEKIHRLGLSADFIQCDLVSAFPCTHLSPAMALFLDPARCVEGHRFFSVEGYHPSLSIIKEWLPYFPSIGVKISPGVKIDEVSIYEAEIEFVSLRGELKEAVLWFGDSKEGGVRLWYCPVRT
jgi:hypothetical protein